MANWRRERDAPTVHVTPDASPGACGIERDRLGATIYDAAEAAQQLCANCSAALLTAAELAIAAAQRSASGGDIEDAKRATRNLLRLFPAGLTRDLVMYARACLARSDRRGAQDALVRWRDAMTRSGVFGA